MSKSVASALLVYPHSHDQTKNRKGAKETFFLTSHIMHTMYLWHMPTENAYCIFAVALSKQSFSFF